MDSLLHYRVLDAVARSLSAARREGFRLAFTSYGWFNLAWLFDYLRGVEHETVSFLWEGGPLIPFDLLAFDQRGWRRAVRRSDHYEIVIVRGQVAVCPFLATNDEGDLVELLLVGERQPGALQEFVDEYCAYERQRTRSERVITVIGGDTIERQEGLEWESLLLPRGMREEIRLQVEGFFNSREVYARLAVPYRRGFLFTGPPGNGKTTLLRVIASQLREPFILLTAHHDTDEADLDRAFQKAVSNAPAILCFEDMDSLFEKKVSLSHFLNKLDGLATLEGILVLATTNHPEELDEALTDRPSRFDRVWLLGNPGQEERRTYLSRQFAAAFDERLVAWTNGFSVAQLKEVWISACLEAIRAGTEAPTLEGARRIVLRLSGQKEAVARDFDPGRPIGFGQVI